MLKSPTLAIFTTTLLMATTAAHAYYATAEEDCSTIDFRMEFPMKMRNQGNISWCYAHSAADYLQFYFKVPVQVSAADLAVMYNRRPWPRLLRWFRGAVVGETGFARTVLWDGIRNGYCPEEYFPSETWVKRYINGPRQGERENKLLMDAINDIVNLAVQMEMNIYRSAADLPFVYEFKDLNADQFYEVLAKSDTKSVLNQLRLAACEPHRKEYPGSIDAIGMRLKGPHVFERINSVIETHTPVNVDFFAGFLNNLDDYGRGLGDLHSTMLMGRRFNRDSGECQYLIKNSYGVSCSGYDSHHQCENGALWVDESNLYRAMVTYVYVKDPLRDDSGPDFRAEAIELPADGDEITAAPQD